MPKILSIDFGSKRCGIAITDESQIIASGLTTIITDNLIDFLKNYFKNEHVEIIVIGQPKNMLNQDSLIEPLILKFIKTININFPSIIIERFDERFTSKLAFRAMIDGGLIVVLRSLAGWLVDRVTVGASGMYWLPFYGARK